MSLSSIQADAPIIASHLDPVRAVAFSNSGEVLATADVARCVRVWRNGELMYERSFRSMNERMIALDRIRALAFSCDDRFLYVAAGELAHCLDAESGEILWSHGRPPTWGFLITCPQAIAPLQDEELAIAYDDSCIEMLREWPAISFQIYENDTPKALVALRDKRRFAGTDFVHIGIWDMSLGRLAWIKPPRKVYSIAASPRADLIAGRSLGSVTVWETETGQPLASTPVTAGLPTLAFSSVDDVLAVGDAKGASIMTHATEPISRIDTPSAATLAIAFSPVEPELALAGSDGAVRLWRYNP